MTGVGQAGNRVEVLVAGAGVAGIGVARRAAEHGLRTLVLEASPRIGGTCGGFRAGGWRFDLGLHCFFTRLPAIASHINEVMGADHREQPLRELVRYDGRWRPYPPLRNLAAYPGPFRIGPGAPAPAAGGSGAQIVRAEAGDDLAQRFVLPQLACYWGQDPDLLPPAAVRIGGLVPRAEIEAGLRAPLDDPPARTWHYPCSGGFVRYVERIGEKVPVRVRAAVRHVDTGRRQVVIADGRTMAYHQLTSSIPLPDLAAMADGMPAQLVKRIQALPHSSVTLVSLCVSAVSPPAPWVYSLGADVPWFRAVFPAEVDPGAAPSSAARAPTAAVQTETYWSGQRPQAARLAESVRASLFRLGLLPAGSRVLLADVRDIRYASTLAGEDDLDAIAEAVDWLAERGVSCVGRYGSWDNARFDQALDRAYSLADRLAGSGAGQAGRVGAGGRG